MFDMDSKPRLKSGKTNVLLVVSSIYQAYACYEIFSTTESIRKCAIVTSYKPSHGDISKKLVRILPKS